MSTFSRIPRQSKCLITADPENICHLLEDNHSPFSHCFFDFFMEVVNTSISMFSIKFQCIQAAWVTAVHSFFKKFNSKQSGGIRSANHGGQPRNQQQ